MRSAFYLDQNGMIYSITESLIKYKVHYEQIHSEFPCFAFACEKGHVATARSLMVLISSIISSAPFSFCGSGPIVIKS